MSETVQSFNIGDTPALYITGLGDFSLARTLDCGQCFRFEESRTHTGTFEGVAHGRFLRLSQPRPESLVLFGVSDAAETLPLSGYDAFLKELTIKTSFVNPFTTARAVSMLASGVLDVEKIIYKELSMEEAVEEFLHPTHSRFGKVLVRVNPDLA